ncbi:hypothetical protein CLOM_g11489 [Closterium sp. NIES-68]|nr:hypothetical protein CLOM_g11489 [Closterium sp. NIES-68]
MGDKEDSGGGDTSVQGGSSTQDSGIAAQRGAHTSQGSLLKEVLKSFTIEKGCEEIVCYGIYTKAEMSSDPCGTSLH